MLAVKLDTGFNIEVEFPITAFHKRLIAWVIDLMVLFSYLWVSDLIMDQMMTAYQRNRMWIAVLQSLPALLYHLLMEVGTNGQSVGKMAMSIKVITLEGGQPSLSQYLLRWMFRIIDITLLFPGFFSVILSPRSQRLGDIVAGTIVIDTKERTSWQDTIFTEIESNYQPRYQQVMQLTDKDINTLKGFIEMIRRKNDHEMAFRISERIQNKLNIQSKQDPYEFLQTLMKDYNYYATNN
jgi:uncharacterized RDD family membrane protein YckC